MIDQKALSIVVPVHNRADLIGRCLDSILRQTYRPLRVVVVDNGSTDGTAVAVREWAELNDVGGDPLFRLDLVEELKAGASAARNRGLREVETEWVYFFDSDDEMLPTLAADAMAAAGDADLVYWRVVVLTARGEREKSFSRSMIGRRHLFNAMLSTQAYMVRTDFLRRLGGWNEDAPVWNDWEVGFRLLLASPRIAVVDKVEAVVHPQAESITGTSYGAKAGQWENTLDIFDRIIDELPQERVENGAFRGYTRRRLHGMVAYRRAILAALYKKEGERELSRLLLEKAVSSPCLTAPRRWLLRLLSAYTVHGGRAAYLLWY